MLGEMNELRPAAIAADDRVVADHGVGKVVELRAGNTQAQKGKKASGGGPGGDDLFLQLRWYSAFSHEKALQKAGMRIEQSHATPSGGTGWHGGVRERASGDTSG